MTFAQTRAAKAQRNATKGTQKFCIDEFEPIPNEGYPKFCIDEFEDLEDYMKVYVRYRIAGGRMKFKESDTGNELRYAQFPGIEFDEVGEWSEDRNNIPQCEWTFDNREYRKWFHSTHPRPVDIR